MNNFLDRLARIKTKQRWGIVAGIVVGIFAAFYMTSYKNSNAQLSEISAQIEETSRTVKKLRAIEKRLPRFEEGLKKLRERLDISMTLLPEKKEIPALLTRITDLGNQSGIEFINFQPGSEKAQNFYAEVPVAIAFQGSYHDLADFLDELRTLRRIVHVRKLSIGGMRSEGGIISLSAKSILVTYRFLSPEEEKEVAEAKKKKGKRRRRRR